LQTGGRGKAIVTPALLGVLANHIQKPRRKRLDQSVRRDFNTVSHPGSISGVILSA